MNTRRMKQNILHYILQNTLHDILQNTMLEIHECEEIT